mmetsp:Transcript_11999/g.25397  ORF Transcript_11999/g.25397 Transcript_11999/m.25397 type:complete len:426 (-) Transcript_11999:213-1490(-)
MKVSLIAFIALLGNVSAAEQASSVASLASNKKERKLNGYYPVHSPTYHYPYFSTPYPTHRPPTPYPTGRAPTERPTPNPTPYPTPHPTPFVHAPTYPEPDHNNGYHPHPDHYPDDNHHDPNPQTRQTPHPTHHPTHRQTPYPTPRPTSRPTPHPTMRPTSDPTPYPTPEPTREPSPGPSPAPSPEPSAYPSAHPSLAPSSLPSAKPSSAPSKTPSDYPSLSPAPSSLEPTQSDEPSENPTQSDKPSVGTAATIANIICDPANQNILSMACRMIRDTNLFDPLDGNSGGIKIIEIQDNVDDRALQLLEIPDDDLDKNIPYTFFAPTNAAYDSIEFFELPFEEQEDTAKYHIISGRELRYGDLGCGREYTMLNNRTSRTECRGARPIRKFQIGDGNSDNDAFIIERNKDARNGIIHLVDGILLKTHD